MKPGCQKLIQNIDNIIQPGGHGLTSMDFAGVLEDGGLVAGEAEGAWSPEFNSISDLTKSDGLLASIGFANRNDYSSYVIQAEPLTGRDIVNRFAETNPIIAHAGWWIRPLYRLGLRAAATRFSSDRPMLPGEFPVYLVFDIEGVGTEHTRPHQIPSEM